MDGVDDMNLVSHVLGGIAVGVILSAAVMHQSATAVSPGVEQAMTSIATQLEPISLAAARINYVLDAAIEAEATDKLDILEAITSLVGLMELHEIRQMLEGMNAAMQAVPQMNAKMDGMIFHMSGMNYSMKQMDSMPNWLMP